MGTLRYAGRMHLYFSEMLPLPRHLFLATACYLALLGFVCFIHGRDPVLASWSSVSGIWSIFNVFVLLRVMDSLKDKGTDRIDFPERPLPSGRVYESDLRWSLGVGLSAFVLVNLPTGVALASALLVLAYLLLMHNWFFVPAILRRDRLLAILTHHPIYPLLFFHCVLVIAVSQQIPLRELDWTLTLGFVMLMWLPFLGWEVARKIHAPEEKTRYETYSSRLGPRGAVAFSLGVEGGCLALAAVLAVRLALPVYYLPIMGFGLALSTAGHLRYLQRLSPTTARLEACGVVFASSVLLAQLTVFWPIWQH